MRPLIHLLLIVLLSTAVRADWWDDFTDSVSEKISSLSEWVKETASPVVREKFNSVKETLQDSETHKAAREWVSEKAGKISDFAQREVIPELKKVYSAATSDDDSTTEKPE